MLVLLAVMRRNAGLYLRRLHKHEAGRQARAAADNGSMPRGKPKRPCLFRGGKNHHTAAHRNLDKSGVPKIFHVQSTIMTMLLPH